MITNDSTTTAISDSFLPVWYRISLYNETTDIITSDTSEFTFSSSEPNQKINHFFTEKPDKIPANSPHSREIADTDWLYGCFAILLFLIVILRITWPVHLKTLFRSAIFPSKGKVENRLFEFRFDSFLVLFLLLYCISYSLLLLAVLVDFNLIPLTSGNQATILFFVFALTFLILIAVKILLSKISSWVFSSGDEGIYYRDHLLLSGFVSAATLIPLVVVNAFSESKGFLFAALAIPVVTEAIRLARSIKSGMDAGTFSYVQIILYFCTLEIIPLLVIGKVIMINLLIS